MTSVWESAWDVANDAFCSLAEDLREGNPDIWWECGHRQSDAFPFSAYASFSKEGIAGEEDVVVSMSFKQEGEVLVFTSDIALGDGQIIAERPSVAEPGNVDRTAWIQSQIAEGLRFIRAQLETLRRLL